MGWDARGSGWDGRKCGFVPPARHLIEVNYQNLILIGDVMIESDAETEQAEPEVNCQLRLPRNLHTRLKAEAAERVLTLRAVMLERLAMQSQSALQSRRGIF
jgi:hypothetical protein